jgi:L-seryl-tRNA(Ser) seleniumtransferase
VEGFTEDTSVAELATLPVPVVADIGSGLVDATCPWLAGPPPAWLAHEPAAVQSLAAGAALVTFSGDKLLGGPQAGIIVGRADLVAACGRHPLARALRPGGLVLAALQHTVLAYLHKRATTDIAFWRMVAVPVDELRQRSEALAARVPGTTALALDALPGAGSAPGVTISSYGIAVPGDHLVRLREANPPIIARTREGTTYLDLRTVDPTDDAHIAGTLGR